MVKINVLGFPVAISNVLKLCLYFCSCSVITKGVVAANCVCMFINPSDISKIQHAYGSYADKW